ncbi:MAG: hypothetical protein KAQ98_12765 [Bacteriovoracaceae bacterium]|nr:hypothetical protein [Bacteriovoracaceae bacterium]
MAWHLCTIFICIFTISSCMEGGPKKGRPTIKDFTSITAVSDFCTDFTQIDQDICYSQCPEGYHEATQEEIQEEIDAYAEDESGGDADKELSIKDQLQEIVDHAKGICSVTPAARPDGEVYIDKSFCACANGEPFIINDCSSFCSGKSSTTPTLYVNVTVGTNILLNENLKNLKGWCENSMPDSDGNFAPSCVLQLFDGVSTLSVQLNFTGDNSFTTDLSQMAKNKTYVAAIVETESSAKSETFQLRAVSDSQNTGDNSPLKIMPISQYSCIQRNGQILTGDNYYLDMARIHYYFPSNTMPPSLPPGNTFLFCHDINTYGENDGPLFPRLELVPNALALWDKTDVRLYDTNPQNSVLDINDIIKDRLLDEYNVSSTISIFQPFIYNYAPSAAFSSSSESSILQGYYMQPWIDSESKLGFCPKQQQYNSSTPVFKILKEIVGVDTEGVYFAKREAMSLTNTDGTVTTAPDDIIIIRETLLKKIWFYYENGQHFVPDDTIAGQRTIMFYYPPDENEPYTRKSYQKIYTVYNPTEDGQNSSIPRTSLIPPNKVFGCVPSIGD